MICSDWVVVMHYGIQVKVKFPIKSKSGFIILEDEWLDIFFFYRFFFFFLSSSSKPGLVWTFSLHVNTGHTWEKYYIETQTRKPAVAVSQ